VRKAIYDAKFNAANNHGMDPDRLIVDEIVIGRCSGVLQYVAVCCSIVHYFLQFVTV